MRPLVDKGIELFMHRLGTGYTMYFNAKNKRSGSLFQGKFKASHINSNEYLLHVSAYVNLNYKIHQLGGKASKLWQSSWDEYAGLISGRVVCKKDIVLKQFDNTDEYKKFALGILPEIIDRKHREKELKNLLLD